MNKLLLMLFAITLLIVASCKKESGPKTPCQMATSKAGGDFSLVRNYTSDKKGRITKTRMGDSEMNYTYSSHQIIEEQAPKDSYKAIYQLDASGKIVSAAIRYNAYGDLYNNIYVYNLEGYLSEVNENDGTSTTVQKYNYTNENLTSITTTSTQSPGAKTTLIRYNNELAPGSFFHYYGMPNVEILKAYFGKTSKNLISEIKQDDSDMYYSYTYQKNAEGNISQMTLISRITFTYDYTYTCK